MARFLQKVNMASETVKSMMKTGEYQVGGVDTAVYGGAFVIVSGLASSQYSSFVTGQKDLSKFLVTAPVTAQVTATNAGVYVTDVTKVADGTIMGNTYRLGAKTIGLQANAGETVALRQLALDDVFILGADNFATAPTVGKYAILTATSVDLTPSATIPTTGLVVTIEQALTITEGTRGSQSAFLCRIEQL